MFQTPSHRVAVLLTCFLYAFNCCCNAENEGSDFPYKWHFSRKHGDAGIDTRTDGLALERKHDLLPWGLYNQLKHHKRGALPIPFYGIEKSKLNNRKREMCDELLQQDKMTRRYETYLDSVMNRLMSYDEKSATQEETLTEAPRSLEDIKRVINRIRCLGGVKNNSFDVLRKRIVER